MSIWALVVAAFIAGQGPITEPITFTKTESECLDAKKEFQRFELKANVEAAGLGCIELKINKGKPV
jgi:hypothetical protein